MHKKTHNTFFYEFLKHSKFWVVKGEIMLCGVDYSKQIRTFSIDKEIKILHLKYLTSFV